jgi:SAM-dependent methyltransferase
VLKVTASNRFDYRQHVHESWVCRRKQRGKSAHSLQDYHTWAGATKARIIDWLPADRNTPILDIGCGPGYFLYLLAELGYTDVTGVDSSPEQISLARQFCPHAKIVQDDLRTILAQHPGTFGLISGFDVVEHFRKDEIPALFALLAQALLPGGRLIVQTPNAESPWVGNIAYGDFTHECLFTPSSLAVLLSQAGLTGFSARPCGPYVHGLKSFVRAVLWYFVSFTITMVTFIELGHKSSGIVTRVFLATAVKE